MKADLERIKILAETWKAEQVLAWAFATYGDNVELATGCGVEGMALGKFAVGAPADLPKRAMRDRHGLTCLRCAPAEQDDLSLDELRARVLGSARR